MQRIGKGVLITVGGAILALTIVIILALPGFLSDRDSTVPGRVAQESRR